MFNEIVDAKPVGPFGVGWNGIVPDSQEQNDNDTPDYEQVSDEDTGSMSTSMLSTSMDNTQTGPTPTTSMDINFDIYGSRFHSINRGSSSVVHCLQDDTEVSYMELDEKCQIDDVLYLSANISVELKPFKDNTCFHSLSVDRYVKYLCKFMKLAVSHIDKGQIRLAIEKRHQKDCMKVNARKKPSKVTYKADSFVYILGDLKVGYHSSVMCDGL